MDHKDKDQDRGWSRLGGKVSELLYDEENAEQALDHSDRIENQEGD